MYVGSTSKFQAFICIYIYIYIYIYLFIYLFHSSDSTFPEKLEALRVGGAPSCAQKKTGRSPKLRYNPLGFSLVSGRSRRRKGEPSAQTQPTWWRGGGGEPALYRESQV